MSEFAKEIISVNIEDELKQSYLSYALSVIHGRALLYKNERYEEVRFFYSLVKMLSCFVFCAHFAHLSMKRMFVEKRTRKRFMKSLTLTLTTLPSFLPSKLQAIEKYTESIQFDGTNPAVYTVLQRRERRRQLLIRIMVRLIFTKVFVIYQTIISYIRRKSRNGLRHRKTLPLPNVRM